MMRATDMTAPVFDMTLVIRAPPGRVLKAFFDPGALAAWWQVANAITLPRPLGPYVVEWAPTDFRDDVLGRLGGVFRGTVMQYEAGLGFFVADAFWLPPDGDPIGPMALHVTCKPVDAGTEVHVLQNGFEESVRWRRYYQVVGHGWERALGTLRALLEK